MKAWKRAVLSIALVIATAGFASAGPFIFNSGVGGVPTGVTLDDLNWLPLGATGGTNNTPGGSGITVTFSSNARVVTGSASGLYAAPVLSSGNGAPFGQTDGTDTTRYITSGSTGSVPTARVVFDLPGPQMYFGLLWGSVDLYNYLDFYSGSSLIGTISGGNVRSDANGDQGIFGTYYVNILSDVPFDRVVARSTQYAFEFDNLAFNPTNPVPEPASMLLLGTGLFGLAGAARRRFRK